MFLIRIKHLTKQLCENQVFLNVFDNTNSQHLHLNDIINLSFDEYSIKLWNDIIK